MKSIQDNIKLLAPDVDRDAPFAYSWFVRSEGRQTLLSMGNAENEIGESSLKQQREIILEFVALEKENRQVTRAIVINNVTIGFVWIELFENHGVKLPSVHIMIGNPEYRGRGIGRAAMQWAINYVYKTLNCKTVYSRHLVNNIPIAKLSESFGFKKDGEPYKEDNGLVWQNIINNIE